MNIKNYEIRQNAKGVSMETGGWFENNEKNHHLFTLVKALSTITNMNLLIRLILLYFTCLLMTLSSLAQEAEEGNEQVLKPFIQALEKECSIIFSDEELGTIETHLTNYFEGKDGELLKSIYREDLSMDPDLQVVEKLLVRYECSLINFTIGFSSQQDTSTINSLLQIEEEMIAMIERIEQSITEPVEDTSTSLQMQQVTSNPISLSLNAQAVTTVDEEYLQVQYHALMSLYNATDGPNWNNNDGWRDADPDRVEDVGNWHGVTTDESGIVTDLDIRLNNLVGNIPAEFGDLSRIITIYLSGNKLSGNIPDELGGLFNLKDLYINSNQLTGPIPSSFGQLDQLSVLQINNNLLSGSIPTELGELSKLTYLALSNNQLTGSIPSELGNLLNLKYLYLGKNPLTGVIPTRLGDLSELIALNLYRTQVSGSIPLSITKLSKLEQLLLSLTQLSGPIPPELGNLLNLRELWLDGTQLVGSIPSELGKLSKLERLLLHNNKNINGPIPPVLGNLSELRYLWLNNTNVSSSIPKELGSLEKLQYLVLNDTRLSGPIPPELGNLSSLTRLYLNNNQLEGVIPANLATNLQVLYFQNNRFTFSGFLELKNDFTSNDLRYSPQGLVDSKKIIDAKITESLTLTTDVDRETNSLCKYQWYKGGVPISTLGVDNHTITLSNVTLQDAGTYHYVIQNEAAPDLTLTSRDMTVNVTDPTCDFDIDFRFYPHSCGTQFLPVYENQNDCSIATYTWDFGDGNTSIESEPFHGYASSGTYQVTLNVTYSCHPGCGILSHELTRSVNIDEDILEENRTVLVTTQLREGVLSVSASSFSDSWMVDYDDATLSGTHPYLNGTKGVWRNKGSHVYQQDRTSSDALAIRQEGTFQLESFSWAHSEYNAIPGWLKVNTITRYSPYSYELENLDVLGNASAAIYGYGGQLPVAVGQNMGHAEMAFTGFEELDASGYAIINDASQKGSGNWTISIDEVRRKWKKFEVEMAVGNVARINATLAELEEIDQVVVHAYSLSALSDKFSNYGFPFRNYRAFRGVSILCKEAIGELGNQTEVALDRVIYEDLWAGDLWYHSPSKRGIPSDISDEVAHTGTKSLRITDPKTIRQNHLSLIPGKTYKISSWLSVNDPHLYAPVLGENLGLRLRFYDEEEAEISTVFLEPSGPLIEGWQKLDESFVCPVGTAYFSLEFDPGTATAVYYDDLRLLPEEGNMQSYVYDLNTYRLKAVLDENNYASLYYYDAEGNLHLTKKETERGIRTLQEAVTYQKESE